MPSVINDIEPKIVIKNEQNMKLLNGAHKNLFTVPHLENA